MCCFVLIGQRNGEAEGFAAAVPNAEFVFFTVVDELEAGGGFIEGAFAATLKDAIPVGIFAASLIWWRFYTFYLYIIVGGLAAGNAALRAIRRRGEIT